MAEQIESVSGFLCPKTSTLSIVHLLYLFVNTYIIFKICSPNKATSRCLVLSYDILCKWHVNRPTLFMTTPSKILILRQILSYLLDRFNVYAISFGIKTPNRSHLQNRRI